MNIKENERLNVLNHSCAHLMAHAVKRLFPKAMFWVGPVIEEGFYYDIDLGDYKLTDEDIPKIEKEMKKIAKDGKKIIKEELTIEQAREKFANDPYKMDIINNNLTDEDTIITAYRQDDFIDLCRGPHVESTKELKHYKLLKFSGAYFKGDSKNKMLQRIYGICFDNEEDLVKHLNLLEEAKQRDHRKIGKELGIFMSSDLVGKGMPMYLPNGYMIWQILENYIKEKEYKLGYQHVLTPPLGSVDLYKTSGHWDHYKDNMFPVMKVDEEEFVLRPMNCPHHMLIFKNELYSYKDLPIRIGEIARDHRYEASGAVKGIERVRSMCQNDAHLFVTSEQIKEEFENVVKLILDVYKDFGITDYKFVLALRDKNDKEKFHPDDEMWDAAEEELRNVLNSIGIPYIEEIGEAAFYGPKLDVQVKPAVGPEYSLSTCQLDFCLPAKFELTYVDRDGSKKTPVVIHRAILGTLDRFMAYILEETKGALPVWLSPVQVNILPVNNEFHLEYSKEILELLKENNLRVELDDRNEKLGYRMREAQTRKIPFTLVLGENEVKDGLVSYRRYSNPETVTLNKEDFIKLIKEEIATKKK